MNVLNKRNDPLGDVRNINQTLSKYLLGAHTQIERILVFNVPNKNLRPLVKPGDQTKFELARMIFQLAQKNHLIYK